MSNLHGQDREFGRRTMSMTTLKLQCIHSHLLCYINERIGWVE